MFVVVAERKYVYRKSTGVGERESERKEVSLKKREFKRVSIIKIINKFFVKLIGFYYVSRNRK